MAYVVAILEYGATPEQIAEVRPSHREYLAGLLEKGKLYKSGPFADDSGAVIIYQCQDLPEGQMLLGNDPFVQHGIVSNATVKEWKIVFGEA